MPRKNLRPLAGKPLIVHSIAPALEVFGTVYVSTEDGEIADVARTHGATVIDRPPELALDETPMMSVVSHALWAVAQNQPKHEFAFAKSVFLLQPTSPLRTVDDLETARELLAEKGCDSVMAVYEAEAPAEWMLRANGGAMLEPAFERDVYHARRQDLPVTYLDGPLYAARTPALIVSQSFLTQRTRYFVVPRERAVDIDDEHDLRFAEFLLRLAARDPIPGAEERRR